MTRARRLPLYPRILAWLCRVGLRLAAGVRVEGLEHVPRDGALIIAANHLSNADPPFIDGWLGPLVGRTPIFLAKEALFVGPLAPIVRSLGARPVKSGGSDVSAYRVARAELEAGGVVAVMPEGTRSRDGRLARPRPGVALLAVRTGAPVLPVGISGTDRFLGRGQVVPRLRAPITLRVGPPFRLTLAQEIDRRSALHAADEELMRRIAALLDPRHRGDWQPWPESQDR
jgi:1-acyl-sn-glycerol-3-phosphate acyltransferase